MHKPPLRPSSPLFYDMQICKLNRLDTSKSIRVMSKYGITSLSSLMTHSQCVASTDTLCVPVFYFYFCYFGVLGTFLGVSLCGSGFVSPQTILVQFLANGQTGQTKNIVTRSYHCLHLSPLLCLCHECMKRCKSVSDVRFF